MKCDKTGRAIATFVAWVTSKIFLNKVQHNIKYLTLILRHIPILRKKLIVKKEIIVLFICTVFSELMQ